MNIKKPATIFILATILLSACGDSAPPEADLPPDAGAIEANNRAVGLMGQFQYADAQSLFAELVSQRPGWNDVKVNLAIATLNRQGEGDELRALELAEGVLQDDPGHLRARYIAGLVKLYVGRTGEALEEFRRVTEADPEDPHAAYYAAQSLAQLGNYGEAMPLYERAMRLDPYLRSAYYGSFQALQRLGRPEDALALAAEYQMLENNPRSHLAEFKYTRMGAKGNTLAVNLTPESQPARPAGEVFTAPEPLPIENPAEFRWQRDGADRAPSITAVDMQGDGFTDLFLADVIETGRDGTTAGNLVLHGGSGGFTARAGHPLAAVSGVNAALWGDFDNDGLVDAYLCRTGENQLWQQAATGEWRNVTATSRTGGGDLDTVDGAFFDADHDGDLDLFLVNANGPNELLNNNLDGTFRPLAADYGLQGTGDGSLTVLPADLDNDRDADIVVLNREPPHEVYINDRLWAYRPAGGFDAFAARPAIAVLPADIDADGMTELFTLTPDGELLRWSGGADGVFRAHLLAAPEVLQGARHAQLAIHDVDGDGRPDIIVSSSRGWAALAVDGGAVQPLYSVILPTEAQLSASLAITGESTSGPAMLTYASAPAGLTRWLPGPGRHPFVSLAFSGRQDDARSMRSNASGVGTRVAVRTGSRWSLLQTYRNHSGPGQSLQPLAVGLGGARRADFVSIDWSDGVFQSEVGVETGRVEAITETQRQLSSCPVLFAWDGDKYAFVSDILGVGGMGYAVGPGQYTTPRPRENFLLPDGLLQPRDGRYVLKVAEPMEENAYLDAARLAIYDLPPGWRMVLDERMGISAPEPTGEPRFYRDEMRPVRAVNDRGEDVLGTILNDDGVAAPVGGLDPRFIGRLQEEHRLSLEFPERLDSHAGEALLMVDGWVEYPYSQTNFAAWQAGAAYEAPTLEAFADDAWHAVHEQFGYPAGMPRRMSVPLSGLPEGTRRLRLRTNMQIYWDRISVVYAGEPPDRELQVLPVAAATLGKTGFARRSNLSQFRPHYDYADSIPFWDTRYMAGYYTRLGPVEELVSAADDAVAIIGPGEEVHLEFQAAATPPEGWQRFFVLETNGWAKDMDLFTRDGETVGPLPSSGKSLEVRDRLHEKYNTRYQAGR